MNSKTSSDIVKRRITRGSERKKKEEEDSKNKKKFHKVVRTRLEEKNIRSLEETRLRFEDVVLGSIFDDDDDGSVTLIEMLKDEVIFRIKTLFKANVLNHLGSKSRIGIACTSYDTMINFVKVH